MEDDEVMSMDETEDEDMDDMEEPPHWSLICGEPCGYKCIDWNGVSTGANQLMVLNTIRQGTAGYERVGAAVTIKAVVIIAAYGSGSNLQGIALVYDHQPNGTLPAYGDICATVSNTGAVGTPGYIWLNPKNSARFELLYYEPHLNFNTNVVDMLRKPPQADKRLLVLCSVVCIDQLQQLAWHSVLPESWGQQAVEDQNSSQWTQSKAQPQ